jgi:aminopeptidase-like protein
MTSKKLYKLAKKIFPIYRSITGEGVRQTLNIFREINPELIIKKIASGKKAFDWTIPPEWKIDEAYIITPKGKKICDIKKNNLHIISYSTNVDLTLSYKKLIKRLHSLPGQPNAIPYRTSYYENLWGFCITDKEKKKLEKKGKYKVFIKSKKFKGVLNYGEAYIKGKSNKEVLISTYICHPSMANNEVSGPTVSTYLLNYVKKKKTKV